MEKFDLNEIIRYFTTGMFFVMISYFCMDPEMVKQSLVVFGNESIPIILIGLCLLSGTVLYVIYRAFLYPFLFNYISTAIVYKRAINNIPGLSKKGINQTIREIDMKRWECNENSRKKLSEWATQIHYLYILSVSCFVVILLQWVVPYVYSNAISLYIPGFVLLIISFIHHVRYKHFEIEIISKNP